MVNRLGEDVTRAYRAGARAALETARREGCSLAVLKQGSPSCGSGEIHDGSFTGRKVPGLGVTARLLRGAGVEVLDEEQARRLIPEAPGQ